MNILAVKKEGSIDIHERKVYNQLIKLFGGYL